MVAAVEHILIATEEDFDFDLQGFLVFQQLSSLVGMKADGTFEVISPGVASDAAGIQTMSDGNLVVASPYEGVVNILNRETGVHDLLAGGLSTPNGLEIGPGDTVWYTELGSNRVRWIDPATRLGGLVSDQVDLPNGLAFAPDSQALYVTANGAGTEGLLKFTRTEDGFDGGTLFLAGAPGDFFDSVETDICGNVYTVEYSTGNVFRVSKDGLIREIIADLVDVGYEGYSSIKWGNDIGEWSSSTLYITNRHKIFALDVGVPGTPDLLPPF
ncbi:MAG: SMP-30/gluconolactonase/LRE family protein [Deltaproteobacteria bacterium]|nr:SMP-30/gluconolactonase/LRE family protein [Deltaproteobacteria bacterium]